MRTLVSLTLAAAVLAACASYVPVDPRAGGAPSVSPGTRTHGPEMVLRSYTVQTGDTVSGIAQKFGLTTAELIARNPGMEVNPDEVHPQELLAIDSGAAYSILTRTPRRSVTQP